MATDPAGQEVLCGTEGFECWRDMVMETRPAETTTDHADDFTASIRRAVMGPAVVMASSFPSIRVKRTRRMIRQHDDEVYHLTLLTAGAGAVVLPDHGRSRTLAPRTLHLMSSSQPYESRFFGVPGAGAEDHRTEALAIDLPMSLLPIPGHRLQPLLGHGLSTHQGAGALLADFLLGLNRQLPVLMSAEAARLGGVAVDLLSAYLAGELDAEDTLSPETRHRTLMRNVRAFVCQHIHDPGLTPSTVAAAHHISLSYLHRLFTDDAQGETLAAYIRRQRLRKAYRNLTDPALYALPVHAIAARCGITHAATFTRAFKAAYGISPSERRRQTMAVQGASAVPRP